MSDNRTLEHVLELMIDLSKAGGWTIESLAEKYDRSKRTIQRYIATIREVGFVVEENRGRYKINRQETKASRKFDMGDLLHFSKEEAWILTNAIESIKGKSAVREKLVRKLYSIYNIDAVAHNIIRQEDSEQVKIIADAIMEKQQVILLEYTQGSANRNYVKTIAEPLAFAHDFSRVWTYLPKYNANILLKLSGLRGVQAVSEPYKYEKFNKIGIMDGFRGYGYEADLKRIQLLLNHRANGFIHEEFPLLTQDIKRKDHGVYHLETNVCDYQPVIRFCLGLPGDVEIIGPMELKKKFNEKFNSSNFRKAYYPSEGYIEAMEHCKA